MISIQHFIFEASGKPSDLKKYKRTERTEKVHFKSGDIYDLKDPGYDEEFKYYDASGNGYIKDKQGHVYDVITSVHNGDAGAIAGGSRDYYVCIKKANGTDDFVVRGYSAVFSSSVNTSCIDDIKAGYYLEDYVAKYYNKNSHGDKFKELASSGNKNAKSYAQDKSDKIQQKKDDFDIRYAALPNKIHWEIVDGEFKFVYWQLVSKSAELLSKKENDWLAAHKLRSYDEEAKNNPEYKQIIADKSNIQEKFTELVQSILKPVMLNRLYEVFKTKDINKLSGIAGTFVYNKELAHGKNFGYKCLAIDTQKKVFVVIDNGDRKVIEDNIKLELSDSITVSKSKASKEMIELFKKVSNAWKKSEGRKQTEYVKNHWEKIYHDSAGGYIWGNHSKTKGQAKAEAKEEFEKMVKDHDFDDPYAKNKIFTYSLALVQVYVEGDMEPDAEPVDQPLENPEPKSERGKNTVMSKGANKAAYDKMKAWHEGTRKQNLSNCSDAKLKMNYRVCKELGYDNEMKQIEAEANKRNIVLESMSLKEMIMATEIDN